MRSRMIGYRGVGLLFLLALCTSSFPVASGKAPREYWIAAESITWDIAPHGEDNFRRTIRAVNRTIQALHYQAYTPGFQAPIPGDPLLGLAGPVIEAEVGDHVIVHFKNLDSYYQLPHSLHVHGFHYTPDMDGGYSTMEPDKPGTAVAYGQTFTYAYDAEPDSVGLWPYHDHSVFGEKSLGLGLYGAIRVRQPGEPRPDREFYLFMAGMDQSATGLPRDYDVFNGLAYMANTPQLMAKRGERVRFNVIGLGTDFHTFHIHGYRWLENGKPEDVHPISPATAWWVEIKADNVGTWMYHCHVEEHMKNGMMGMFMVM